MADDIAIEPTCFTDNAGRVWRMSITLADLKRVRELTGVKIGDLIDDNFRPLVELLSDLEKLVDVIYVLCEPEATKLGVTAEQFGRGLFGDAIEAAAQAFQRALANFFPSRVRQMMSGLTEKGQAIQARLTAIGMKKIAAIDVEKIVEMLSKPVTDSVASAASTHVSSV